MDLSKLTPPDGAVTLRGLERRYRNLFAEADEKGSPDELANLPADNGWTALEHIVAAAWDIAASSRALDAVATRSTPLLDAADVDPTARSRPMKPTGTVHERLAELGMEASVLADRVDQIAAAQWDRYGLIDDGSGRRVTALDILRSAVDSGVTHLRSAEHVLTEVTEDEIPRQE